MPLLALPAIHPISSIRNQGHIQGRFALREEINYNRYFLRYISPFYILFFFVDWQLGAIDPTESLLLRIGATATSYFLFQFLRGRARYLTRSIATCAPFYFVLQYLAISNDLVFSPYMIGYALVSFTNVVFFPSRLKYALYQQSFYSLPTLFYLFYEIFFQDSGKDILLTFTILNLGLLVLTTICADASYSEIMKRYQQYEKITSENKSKSQEIARRSEELARYQVFRNQLSPDVAREALNDPGNLAKRVAKIVTIVFDIKDSTNRSFFLELSKYDRVIEEVSEIFVNACNKFHITVDKYIGDGVQAFVGAPIFVPAEQGVTSALKAISYTLHELQLRRESLEILWERKLLVKFSLTVGDALVGFHGRSAIQNYTATGPYVSLAHRLCGLASETEVALHAQDPTDLPIEVLRCESFMTESIKGLEARVDSASGQIIQRAKSILVYRVPVDPSVGVNLNDEIASCKRCNRPLFLSESKNGQMIAYSTECDQISCEYIVDGLTRAFVSNQKASG
jgi:class 3 adenylate cyclase